MWGHWPEEESLGSTTDDRMLSFYERDFIPASGLSSFYNSFFFDPFSSAPPFFSRDKFLHYFISLLYVFSRTHCRFLTQPLPWASPMTLKKRWRCWRRRCQNCPRSQVVVDVVVVEHSYHWWCCLFYCRTNVHIYSDSLNYCGPPVSLLAPSPLCRAGFVG